MGLRSIEPRSKGLRPHDLLRISNPATLPEFSKLPAWAQASLRACPVVVVRRAVAPDGFLPIGIRGNERSQRAAAILPADAVEACISPEKLAARKPWLDGGLPVWSRAALPQFQALRQVAEAAAREVLTWGPTGSIGFELATGAHVIRVDSDVDILIRFASGISTTALTRFRAALSNAIIHVDVLLEEGCRGAALNEYLASPQRVLIKTPDGPQLGAFPG